ncbi:MAG: N-formylglutamate amidohydrolase [Candidatus Kapaibacterium sp.]
MIEPFIIREARAPVVPFILSVPHCGTEFPEEIREDYVESMAAQPDDTDWFVHDLYNFASDLGITVIHARYSRWVIDLNRDPESRPLYNDGRIITGLTPSTDFLGQEIYVSDDRVPDEEEVARRLDRYYWPYHNRIATLLQERVEQFGKVILWDAHSIRHFVPTIREEQFPDMILGDNDGVTAAPSLIEIALENLRSGSFGVNHNSPFKGGSITRSFGKPEENIHALQLEMNKILYMDDTELLFDEERANVIRPILKQTFVELLKAIENL